MGHIVAAAEFEVSGDIAMFSEPIQRTGGGKASYPIPTYEAIKGICKSIYWKPSIIWIVDSIRVMNRIERERPYGVRTLNWADSKNGLQTYLYLRKVRYQVKAHIEYNLNRPEMASDRNDRKHRAILERSLENPRYPAFLGCSECEAYVTPCIFGEGEGYYDGSGKMEFGVMYHGITYPDEAYSPATRGAMTVRMDEIVMDDGIINFTPPSRCGIQKFIKKMEAGKLGISIEEEEKNDAV